MTIACLIWFSLGFVGACGRAFASGYAPGGMNTPIVTDVAGVVFGPVSFLFGMTQVCSVLGSALARSVGNR